MRNDAARVTEYQELLSVEEILGGFPARRASSVLFAIEGRTAQLVARSRRAMARDYSGYTAAQQEQAFLDSIQAGANLPLEPNIQDIERYAEDWLDLVPSHAALKAAVFHQMADKYALPIGKTHRIQGALTVDSAEVREAYLDSYGQPIQSMFATTVPAAERWRWLKLSLAERLENLPPFWTAFSLTLTETVGAGVLALPIALAEIGPLGGIAIILLLGMVNVLTISAMAEAVARNGNIRYGDAYLGRVVDEYLGRPGRLVLAPALFLMSIGILFAYAIGFSTTLANAVGLSPMVWAAVLLALILHFVRKESINATVATALVVGIITISLLLFICLLSIPHVSVDNLRHSELPLTGGNGLDSTVIELIFGVVLLAFFGHTSTANCAAVVLRRDPGAKSLIRGCAAAMVVAALVYTTWVVVASGAVPAGRLAQEQGTALVPLAEVAGSGITVTGVLFVVIAMGMASVHMGWAVANSVREWLPEISTSMTSRRRLSLSRRQASLLPIVLLFGTVEILLLIDKESFAKPISVVGVVAIPIVSGIFAMLMLAASRSTGDYPADGGIRFLGRPAVVALLCAFFVSAMALHGLVVWSDSAYQAIAIAAAAIAIVVIGVSWRSMFSPRLVVEVRYEGGTDRLPSVLAVNSGCAGPVTVSPYSPNGDILSGFLGTPALPGVSIELPPASARELKVWVHQIEEGQSSQEVPSHIELRGAEVESIDSRTGTLIVPITEIPEVIVVVPATHVAT